MTKLTNVLKTMKTEAEGVRNDVINFLLSQAQDSEDAQSILENVLMHGCQSGMVNHLIYYKDTVAYFEDNESEIREFVTDISGIVEIESWDGIDELADMFPQLDDAETRHIEAEDEVIEKAINETPELYGNEWDEMDEMEQMDAIQDYASSIMVYENNPMELTDIDKNYLAWAIFEYEAENLENELSEMEVL